jgi:hypothetical protein
MSAMVSKVDCMEVVPPRQCHRSFMTEGSHD